MNRKMQTRSIVILIILAIFFLSELNAAAVEGVLSRGKTFSLPDLYRLALKRSEQIKISEENVFIAEMNRERALSVLIPEISSSGSYSRHEDEPKWTTLWGLNARQSITMNGKELIALRAAGDTIVKNEYDLHTVREKYLFGVASAYYDVLKGKSAVVIAESNVKRLEKHRESVSIRLQLEDVPKTAYYRAEAELSQAGSDLISANNNTKIAKAYLAKIVGIPNTYELRGPGVIDTGLKEPALAALKANALENRSELKSYRIEKDISNDMAAIARSAYWPVISAEAGYSYYDNENATDGMDNDDIYATLSLSVSLFDGGLRSAELRQALARKRQAILALRELESQVAVEVEEAYLELVTHQSVIKSLTDQLEFSRENYNAVSKQFRHGLANSVDVMDANTLLVTSQKQLSESRYDYQLSVLKLERARGIFLQGVMDEYLQ